jgi:hypothetical protein
VKYLCLGYFDESKWDAMPEAEREAFMAECLAYDAVLHRDGRVSGAMALESATAAATLRWGRDGVSVTDGPFAETKEQLGGVFVLEADDLNHAIQLMSKHPGVRVGPFEVWPVDEAFTARIAEETAAGGRSA